MVIRECVCVLGGGEPGAGFWELWSTWTSPWCAGTYPWDYKVGFQSRLHQSGSVTLDRLLFYKTGVRPTLLGLL